MRSRSAREIQMPVLSYVAPDAHVLDEPPPGEEIPFGTMKSHMRQLTWGVSLVVTLQVSAACDLPTPMACATT